MQSQANAEKYVILGNGGGSGWRSWVVIGDKLEREVGEEPVRVAIVPLLWKSGHSFILGQE